MDRVPQKQRHGPRTGRSPGTERTAASLSLQLLPARPPQCHGRGAPHTPPAPGTGRCPAHLRAIKTIKEWAAPPNGSFAVPNCCNQRRGRCGAMGRSWGTRPCPRGRALHWPLRSCAGLHPPGTAHLCLGRQGTLAQGWGSFQHLQPGATAVTSCPSQATFLLRTCKEAFGKRWEKQEPSLSPVSRALSSAPWQTWSLPAAGSHQRNFRIKMYHYYYLSE